MGELCSLGLYGRDGFCLQKRKKNNTRRQIVILICPSSCNSSGALYSLEVTTLQAQALKSSELVVQLSFTVWV